MSTRSRHRCRRIHREAHTAQSYTRHPLQGTALQQSCPSSRRSLSRDKHQLSHVSVSTLHLHLKISADIFTQNRATFRGIPIALVSRGAMSFACFSIRSAIFCMAAALWTPVHLDHGPLKAASAASTAASTSASPATWMPSATSDSSSGL